VLQVAASPHAPSTAWTTRLAAYSRMLRRVPARLVGQYYDTS